MLVLEAKLKGKESQYGLIQEAIRTALFCRNKALRYWLDNEKVSGYDLNKQMAVLGASHLIERKVIMMNPLFP